jgi:hypothetical protein
MRAYLENWILHDGQLPEPAVGDTIRGIGLWMTCRACGPSTGMDAWDPVPSTEHGGWTTDITLDGEVIVRQDDPEAGIVRVSERLFVVEGEFKEFGEGAEYEEDPVDLRLIPVGLPDVGLRTSLVGNLGIMPEHEFDEGYRFHDDAQRPDVRADWLVTAIHQEYREPRSDRVVDVNPVERIDAWADAALPLIYVLDLAPTLDP